MRNASWLVLALAIAVVLGVMLLVPPIAQDPAYHEFADRTARFGVPNFANVVSNAPFVAVGMAGAVFALEARGAWACYVAFFVGVALTGFGSAYYHLAPDDGRLFWDRLPMTVAFASLLSAVAAERISRRMGAALLPVLLVVGASSVVYWRWTEGLGAGDLRPYVLVQFCSMGALLVLAARARDGGLLAVVGCYVIAKVFEMLDAEIYALGSVVSGHTLKHLVAAAAACLVLPMLYSRSSHAIAPDKPVAAR